MKDPPGGPGRANFRRAGRGLFQQLGEHLQSPVRGHAYGSGTFPQHLCGGVGVKVHDNAQQHRLGLVTGKPCDQSERGADAGRGQGGPGRVLGAGQVGQILRRVPAKV